MISQGAYMANLRLASLVKQVPGDIVECGTWRGGMIAGLAQYLGACRNYHLFDSFEGMPAAREIDGEAALAWQKNTSGPFYYGNCLATEEEARQTMAMSGATQYRIVKGWFHETLPASDVKCIALLRMDADWYDSTKQILHYLGNRVVSGGIIVVDDYYTFQGCTKAVNEYAAERKLAIRQSPGGVCYLVI